MKLKLTDSGTLIAERQLEGRENGKECSIIVRIGKPFHDEDNQGSDTAEALNEPPLLEMADVIRTAGRPFIKRSHNWITWHHLKVLKAIQHCRTAALGGHRDQCSDCEHSAISYNSCRNRHCPKCQGDARVRWLQAREQELLPSP
jgi:hypothetical protein